MERELICIGCPMGCRLSVKTDKAGELTVTGNTCKRGEQYGKKEVTCPERTLTGTVAVRGGVMKVCSVRTARDVPKETMFAVMSCINTASAEAPIHIGDVIIENVAGTGVNVVATRNVKAVDK